MHPHASVFFSDQFFLPIFLGVTFISGFKVQNAEA